MDDNSIPFTRRRHVQEFCKAMQVVDHLNIYIQNILRRYNIARDTIHPAYASSLHRRLKTIEGVRSVYLEYARIKMTVYQGEEDTEDLPEEHSDFEESDLDLSVSGTVSDSDFEASGYEADFSDTEDEELPRETVPVLSVSPPRDGDDSIQNQPESSTSDVTCVVASAIQSSDHCADLHVQGQLEVIVFTSDDGGTTLDDLSEDEVDLFSVLDITHRRM